MHLLYTAAAQILIIIAMQSRAGSKSLVKSSANNNRFAYKCKQLDEENVWETATTV